MVAPAEHGPEGSMDRITGRDHLATTSMTRTGPGGLTGHLLGPRDPDEYSEADEASANAIVAFHLANIPGRP